MNIDEINFHHSTLTNGTAGLLISLITCSETAVPIRIGSISLYFPDCMFGEDRSRLTVGCEIKKTWVPLPNLWGVFLPKSKLRNLPPPPTHTFHTCLHHRFFFFPVNFYEGTVWGLWQYVRVPVQGWWVKLIKTLKVSSFMGQISVGRGGTAWGH